MKLILNRSGKFPCRWLDIENMCGTISTTEPTYNYECHLETADILDNQGFIINQLDVDKYFQDRYTKDKRGYNTRHKPQSCERIAINAVNEIKKMVEDHMLKTAGMSLIYRIAVTISFGPGQAKLTAEWTPENEKEFAGFKTPVLSKMRKP